MMRMVEKEKDQEEIKEIAGNNSSEENKEKIDELEDDDNNDDTENTEEFELNEEPKDDNIESSLDSEQFEDYDMEVQESDLTKISESTEELSDAELSAEEEGESIAEDEVEEEEDLAEEELVEKQIKIHHRNQIEAALYASGRPLSVEELSTKLEISKTETEELVNELAFDYLDRSTALIITQIGDKYKLQVKSEYIEGISDFAQGGAIAEKYLRTLTVIALKQPIMKSLLVKIRGSGAYEHVKYLEENELIDSVKKGRSSELTTTDKYAEMWGLPKDKAAMKQVMIAQLGLQDENDDSYQQDDSDLED